MRVSKAYDYCGKCFKVINLSKFSAYNPLHNTFMADSWECPKCKELNTDQSVLSRKIVKERARSDKKACKQREKENRKYWRYGNAKTKEGNSLVFL